ncbi:hypothetical protein FSP39_001467 [Pinctada imbricata]|uniref:Protein-tyrosine sulfotransferase n=1 Tax=Pinctada imbricata TaxID=66713 RepID=A0AA89C3Z2_PINIB|nr:hypothetical protein FSP39_001467 [Pinctada imbricata]
MTTNNVAKIIKKRINGNDKRLKEMIDEMERLYPEGSMSQSPREDFVPVLVLAYLRSGSSFTADIIQQAKGSFYVFEPLRNLLDREKIKSTASCNDTEFMSMECREPSTINFIIDQITKFYRCDYKVSFLVPDPHQGGSENQIFYANCLRATRQKPGYCFQLMRRICYKSSVRIIKTIRLSVDLTKMLLENIPNLKIIHLIRDPRAVVGSRQTGDFMKKTNLYLLSPKELCMRYEKDIAAAKEVERIWPTGIRRIHYEDLATDPHKISRGIYEFLGLRYLPGMTKWIEQHTSARSAYSYYGTLRTKSSEMINKWKKTLPNSLIHEADQVCASFYKSVNNFYKTFATLNRSMSKPN